MAKREVHDLLIGISITVVVISSSSFFNPQSSLKDTEETKEDLSQVEKDKRMWVVQCREALKLNQSKFNTEVDKIFYKRHEYLNRRLHPNSEEDIQYRLEWDQIAESILKQNKNFNKTEDCKKN